MMTKYIFNLQKKRNLLCHIVEWISIQTIIYVKIIIYFICQRYLLSQELIQVEMSSILLQFKANRTKLYQLMMQSSSSVPGFMLIFFILYYLIYDYESTRKQVFHDQVHRLLIFFSINNYSFLTTIWINYHAIISLMNSERGKISN